MHNKVSQHEAKKGNHQFSGRTEGYRGVELEQTHKESRLTQGPGRENATEGAREKQTERGK